MNANTAVTQRAGEQAGAMVRSGTCIYTYWHLKERGHALALRVRDLSGRPASELLDGVGVRLVSIAIGQTGVYLENLLPGHLYAVEVGERTPSGFRPLFTLAPVQTPWTAAEDQSAFPSQYHRS